MLVSMHCSEIITGEGWVVDNFERYTDLTKNLEGKINFLPKILRKIYFKCPNKYNKNWC